MLTARPAKPTALRFLLLLVQFAAAMMFILGASWAIWLVVGAPALAVFL